MITLDHNMAMEVAQSCDNARFQVIERLDRLNEAGAIPPQHDIDSVEQMATVLLQRAAGLRSAAMLLRKRVRVARELRDRRIRADLRALGRSGR